MGIVSTEAFVTMCTTDDHPEFAAMRREAHAVLCYTRPDGSSRSMPMHGGARVDRASALAAYEKIRGYIRERGFLPGKFLRPWFVDKNIYAGLDRSQPWWGFEFETGYRSQEQRAEVIDHVWNTWNNVAFDSEGEGQAAVEITFAPQEMSKYLDGTADAFKFMEYLTGNPRTYRGQNESVGTHINLSDPCMTPRNVDAIATSLSRSIAALPTTIPAVGDVRLYMFGRSRIYGGFNGHEEHGSVWVEGKLFRTTYDVEVFKRYLKVCEGLTRCMHATVALGTNLAVPFVNNLYEVCFEGAEPEIMYVRKAVAYCEGIRGDGRLNNGLQRDLPGVEVYDTADAVPAFLDRAAEQALGSWCDVCQAYH